MLIYDSEIIKAIPNGTERLPGIEYCGGWGDHIGMGISCICAYDYIEARFRVFLKDNFDELRNLMAKRDIIIGFNSVRFDNKLLAANGFDNLDGKSYDLFKETGVRSSLDDICSVNFGYRKTGNGALAPVEWQRGNFGKVIDYCMNDVKLTKRLTDHVIIHGFIRNPKSPDSIVRVRRPS